MNRCPARRFPLAALAGSCLLSVLTAHAAQPAAPGLSTVTYKGQSYLIREIDPRKEDLRLFLNDDQGNGLRDFAALDKLAQSHGERLLFAANAGMYTPAMKPVGLLVQNGVEQNPLNLHDGTGNFSMKPNGVFVINTKHEAMVVESSTYPALLTPVLWATQSGPMLVYGGTIHPDFIEDSKSEKIRSGVGVRKDGTIFFALSTKPVNFYNFAVLFLNQLHCPNALFLDGTISAFYVPGRKDSSLYNFGPMFGLVEKAKP